MPERARREAATEPAASSVAAAVPPTRRVPGNRAIAQRASSARASPVRARLGGGRVLDRSTVEALGPSQLRGSDRVRVHTDAPADELAARFDATAFTSGGEVFFRRGTFSPASIGGRQLIAHELGHVAQQRRSPATTPAVSRPSHPSERAAAAFAARLDGTFDASPAGDAAAPNRSMVSLLSDDVGPPLVVHRHASWEHTLIGDTPPGRLGRAAVSREARRHVLYDEWQRMMFFKSDPAGDPRARFPDVRWIKLRGSELWVSYGELNALADYLPGPGAIDSLDREAMIPVLQNMRSGVRRASGAEFGLRGSAMEGQAWSSLSIVSQAAGDVRALDEATASLGTQRYQALLARNACHFAPYSWQRWMLYHNEARELARSYYHSQKTVAPVDDVDTTEDEYLRQAILTNGYGDHFIQDSFAAGHLVNKTLVMQWFVEYLNGLSWYEVPWFGLPSDSVMESMDTASQPGIAGRELYGLTPSGKTAQDDQMFGGGFVDPQTLEERASYRDRVAGSGVRAGGGATVEQNYQRYLDLLNSAFIQLGAGATHDYFNQRGLSVRNARGDQFTVGGDDTLLSESSALGAQLAGEAAHTSQQAIDELLETGTTGITVEQILELVPSVILWRTAGGGWKDMPLEQWQDDVLHDICIEEIFPDLVDTLSTSTIVRAFSSELVEGGHSQDSSGPPPPEPRGPMGDFPLPSGSTRFA